MGESHLEWTPRGTQRYLSIQLVVEAIEVPASRILQFTFDKQRFYKRLGWSVLERAPKASQSTVVGTLPCGRRHPLRVETRQLGWF